MTTRPVAKPLRFDDLYSHTNFCAELGRAILAASTLETEMKRYLASVASVHNTQHDTLGRLLTIAKQRGLLKDLHPHLELAIRQRNSFAHRLHAILLGGIHDDLLSEPDLIDSDVALFAERAWQLATNLHDLAGLVAKHRLNHERPIESGGRGMTPNHAPLSASVRPRRVT